MQGGSLMDVMIIPMIMTSVNLVLILGFAGLGIYALILAIKALKIYINKNS